MIKAAPKRQHDRATKDNGQKKVNVSARVGRLLRRFAEATGRKQQAILSAAALHYLRAAPSERDKIQMDYARWCHDPDWQEALPSDCRQLRTED